MSRGKRYGDDVREQVFALLDTVTGVREIAKQLGVPASTVSGWKNEYIEQRGGEGPLNDLREQKRMQFVRNAWNVIENGQKLLMRRMERAACEEERIDKAIDTLLSIPVTPDSIPQPTVLLAVKNLSAIKLEDPSKLSSVIGTMYDKQALASKNDASDVNVVIRRFEDF